MDLQQADTVRLPRIGGNTDTSLLKIIALVFMVVDHIGAAYFPRIMELRVFGRIAMPLYAWCLVVGSEYTRNALKYAFRLFILGVIAQPFYIMLLSHAWTDFNILFLFSIAVLAIAGIKEKRWGSQFWAPALCIILVQYIHVDYGLIGLLFILVLYTARHTRSGIAASLLTVAAYWGTVSFPVAKLFRLPLSFMDATFLSPVRELFFQMQALMWLALPLILIHTHSNIRMPKWLGYGLYPLHLIALIILGLILGVPLSSFTASLARI